MMNLLKNTKFLRIFRLAIGISLLVFLLYKADLRKVISLISSLNLTLFFLAIFVSIGITFISSYRWQILLGVRGIKILFFNAASLYFIGAFFNNFLPTSFGGDGIRAYEFSKDNKKVEDSVASVLMDRFIGVFTLIPIVIIAAILGPKIARSGDIIWSIAILLGTCILIAIFIFNKNLARRFKIFLRPLSSTKLEKKIGQFYDAINVYKGHPKGLFYASIISLIYQLANIYTVFLISLALGLKLSFISFLIYIPIITVISMLPISINGVGIQEGGFIFLFREVGVDTANAFSMSVLFHVLRFSCGLVGGIIYLLKRG